MTVRLRTWTIPVLLVLGLLAPTALRADSVILSSGLAYNDVRITDARNCHLVFSKSGRAIPPKPISGIQRIKFPRNREFSAAEEHAAEGRWLKAVQAYDAAERNTKVAWLKRLIVVRRLMALDRSRQIGRAVAEWFKIVEESKLSPAALTLRPSHTGVTGSKTNAAAIALLEGKKPAGPRAEVFKRAIEQLLLELYVREQKRDKAVSLAAKVEAETPSDRMNPIQRRLKSVEILLAGGKPAEARRALDQINADLRKYRRKDLPLALLQRGRCQMILAHKDVSPDAGKRRTMLLQAGLNFMRVVAEFSSLPEAAEALVAAGRMHLLLTPPNLSAARAAAKAVLAQHPKSSAAQKAVSLLRAVERQEKKSNRTNR